MIIKDVFYGGFVWIEHDDSVDPASRIYVLKCAAPAKMISRWKLLKAAFNGELVHDFAMGAALAKMVGEKLTDLTKEIPS